MVRICDMHGEPEKEIEWILGLDRRIILKWILKNRVGVHILYLSTSQYGQMVGCRECICGP